MSNEKIIDRIKKILARATSANVHEAATAAALAQELLQKHKLTEADVAGFESEIGDHELEGEGFLAAWRFGLITAIAESCFCRTLRILESRKATIRVVGLKQDFETVKFIFEFLAKEIERLCDEMMPGEDRAKKDSFRRGAVVAIQHRLLAQTTKFSRSSEKAMILVRDNEQHVDAFINKNYSMRERDTDLGQAQDQDALHSGYLAGRSIPIPGKGDDHERHFDDDLDDLEDFNVSASAFGQPVYVTCVIEVRIPDEFKHLPLQRFLETHVTDEEIGTRLVRVIDVKEPGASDQPEDADRKSGSG
jgi:hypothetical protein